VVESPDTAQASLKAVVIDDEAGVRDICARAIRAAGGDPYTAATGAEGLALARNLLPKYVFLDVGLTDLNGMELLRSLHAECPAIRVVMITGLATVEMAVEAMKLGAHDYLAKPHIVPQIREMIADAIRDALPSAAPAPAAGFCGLIGVSRAMQQVYALIAKAARADATVLIQGESGTGKELVARAIHSASPRASQPFVPVDCGAIPSSLIESELFGHAAGAYTDARTAGPGLLRSARGGTAFLDEIGELPTTVQVKLLRALQEMEVRPVGSAQAEPLSARIIAATNRDLAQAIALGRFRRDLFYRLHVIPIFIQPLRERREDVPLLAEHFMRECAARSGRAMKIAPDALESLMSRDWPGNVRELQNVIRRAFALLDGDTIRLSDMPFLFDGTGALSSTAPQEPLAAVPNVAVARGHLLHDRTAEAVRDALRQTNDNKRQAARLLGIGIATLYRKMKQYGINP
jgi:two-component system response regulator HydG